MVFIVSDHDNGGVTATRKRKDISLAAFDPRIVDDYLGAFLSQSSNHDLAGAVSRIIAVFQVAVP